MIVKERIKSLIEREESSDSKSIHILKLENKLSKIFQEDLLFNEAETEKYIRDINNFIASSEINKQKALLFCANHNDQIILKNQNNINSEEIQQLRNLKRSKLLELYNYVNQYFDDNGE